MMTSEEMTRRVLERLHRHRERISRRNGIIRALTFGLVDLGREDGSRPECMTEYRKGKAMSTKRSTAATAASMAFVIGAVITATALTIGRNAPDNMTDDVSMGMTENEMTEDMGTDIEEPADEPVEEPTEPVYYPLELRESEMRHYTDEELWALQEAARENYAENGPRLIDRSHYLKYFEEGGDPNCLEAKSYIIHMMANSVDYYNTISGKALAQSVYTGENPNVPDVCNTVEYTFRADIAAQFSYLCTVNTHPASPQHQPIEYYHYDNTDYTDIDASTKTYKKNSNYEMPDMNLSINDFYTVGEDGYGCYSGRPNRLNLFGYLGEILHPQQLPFSWMDGLDSWKVDEVKDCLGYRCAVIGGYTSSEDLCYTLYLDLEHGIILRQHYFNENVDESIDITAIELDGEIDETPFDTTGYEEIIDNIV